MHLLTSAEISLTPLSPATDHQPPLSAVVRRGEPTLASMEGAILEAAFQWQDFFLLFATDDIPFEDTLRIGLFDTNFQRLDTAAIGGMYSTGSFSLLDSATSDDRVVRFRFIGDTDWSVEVLLRPQRRLPLLPEPRGVTRPLGFSQHFIVHGNPQPQPR